MRIIVAVLVSALLSGEGCTINNHPVQPVVVVPKRPPSKMPTKDKVKTTIVETAAR